MNLVSPNIVWIRNDLRLNDNPALYHAAKQGSVIPVFIWAPHEEDKSPGAATKVWLNASLRSFQKDLYKLGVRLLFAKGNSLDVLKDLINRSNAEAVFWNERYEPKIHERDQQIKNELLSILDVQTYNGNYFLSPGTVKNSSGSPFKVFTPFWKNCLSKLDFNKITPKPKLLRSANDKLVYNSLEDLNLTGKAKWEEKIALSWNQSEADSHEILTSFLRKSHDDYNVNRNLPSLNGTSTLSPYLRFGQISPNYILHKLRASLPRTWKNSQFLAEIGWREFSCHLLFHYPELITEPLRKEFKNFPWLNNKKHLSCWTKGLTGYPFVDAGMRQLWQTGWMHNRVRMVVASFLVKDLLIDWRKGAEWFWDTLVDADLASNTLGWQWVAGCGADAAPYFRVFNPVLQSRKFDANGKYIKKWINQLSKLNSSEVHLPNQENELFDKTGDYPNPIVNHSEARINALAAYKTVRGSQR